MSTSSVATAAVIAPLNMQEAAELMRCSERTVRRRVAAGKLAHIRDGAGRLLFKPEFIADYFARNTKAASPRPSKPARNPRYR